MRVLLVRTSALGDIVHCLPVVSGLRRALPEAHIGWVVEEVFAPLLEEHPDLDEVISVGLRPWRRRPASVATGRHLLRFLRRVRRFRADAVLDLMGNHKAGLIALATGCRRRIGAARRFRREPSSALWLSDQVATPGSHVVDRALALAGPLGVVPSPVELGGDRLPDRVPEEGRALLDRIARPFVLLQPGASWGNKRYPAAWWGEVSRELARNPGLPVRILSGPGEEALAATVAEASGGGAVALPATGLVLLVALLRRATLVLGGDTGPVHLAHALGTPVLCLMGPTDPSSHGPYGDPAAALYHRLPCSFCHRRFDAPRACLLEIAPGRVAEAARERLARSD